MKTLLIIKPKTYILSYTCPHCKETTRYETSGDLPKPQCHKCLKKLVWKVQALKI